MADKSIRIYDGQLNWQGGVDDSKPPTIASQAMPQGLQRNMLSWLSNGTCRGGVIRPRTGWLRKVVVASGGGPIPPTPPTPPVTPLSIVTLTLPDACKSGSYSSSVFATGTALAVSPAMNFWEISAGSVPPGMAFVGGYTSNPYGTVQGVSTITGSYTFTVKVTAPDSSTASKSYTILVRGITSSPILPHGHVGVAYNEVLTSFGFSSPVFSLGPGTALPPNLALSPGGVISGIPTLAGNTSFVVEVTDGTILCQETMAIQIQP